MPADHPVIANVNVMFLFRLKRNFGRIDNYLGASKCGEPFPTPALLHRNPISCIALMTCMVTFELGIRLSCKHRQQAIHRQKSIVIYFSFGKLKFFLEHFPVQGSFTNMSFTIGRCELFAWLWRGSNSQSPGLTNNYFD